MSSALVFFFRTNGCPLFIIAGLAPPTIGGRGNPAGPVGGGRVKPVLRAAEVPAVAEPGLLVSLFTLGVFPRSDPLESSLFLLGSPLAAAMGELLFTVGIFAPCSPSCLSARFSLALSLACPKRISCFLTSVCCALVSLMTRGAVHLSVT